MAIERIAHVYVTPGTYRATYLYHRAPEVDPPMPDSVGLGKVVIEVSE
jgi:hypothetical protein